VPYTNNAIAQLIVNKNNSQVSYCNQISYLQTQHILAPQSYSCVAEHNSRPTVMVITTFLKIVNEKVGYHFAM